MSRAAMQAALDHIVASESEPSWEGYAIGCDKARDILRAALAQAEPPCPHIRSSGTGKHSTHWCALAAQPEQPVIPDEMVTRAAVLAERERIAAELEQWRDDLRGRGPGYGLYLSGRADGLHDAAALVRAGLARTMSVTGETEGTTP